MKERASSGRKTDDGRQWDAGRFTDHTLNLFQLHSPFLLSYSAWRVAKIDLVVQGLTSRFHADELRKLLSKSECKRVLASVAFVREDGVAALAGELKVACKVTTFFVGIRNGVTSVQGLRRLVELGLRVFAVDTASRGLIFHPKLFLVEGLSRAAVLIGSANLTFPGLHNNIEAGVILDLNLSVAADKKFLANLVKTLEDLPLRFPEHVFQVKDLAAVEALFEEGRLLDEDVAEPPPVTAYVRTGARDSLKPMKLPRHAPPPRKHAKVKIKPKGGPQAQPSQLHEKAPPEPGSGFLLVWESRGLTERDLNVPKGDGTHATGSMLWKKGAAEGIDQRHFFRDEVFAGLDWQRDPSLPHYERTQADFFLVVKGINCGKFTLRLSNNSDTTTRTYEQKNAMTQVHWGKALSLVAKRDLLGRIISLYRKESNPPEFLIEID